MSYIFLPPETDTNRISDCIVPAGAQRHTGQGVPVARRTSNSTGHRVTAGWAAPGRNMGVTRGLCLPRECVPPGEIAGNVPRWCEDRERQNSSETE